jgi:hypothetical protein
MPLPVVIAEGGIPLTTERVTAPVISNSYITSTIKRSVLRAIEVSVPIDRYVITIAKLVGVAKTINVLIPRPVRCDVSLPIRCCVVAGTQLLRVSVTINLIIPCPVRRGIPFTIRFFVLCSICREISLAINRCVIASANLGVPVASRRYVSVANCSRCR